MSNDKYYLYDRFTGQYIAVPRGNAEWGLTWSNEPIRSFSTYRQAEKALLRAEHHRQQVVSFCLSTLEGTDESTFVKCVGVQKYKQALKKHRDAVLAIQKQLSTTKIKYKS